MFFGEEIRRKVEDANDRHDYAVRWLWPVLAEYPLPDPPPPLTPAEEERMHREFLEHQDRSWRQKYGGGPAPWLKLTPRNEDTEEDVPY